MGSADRRFATTEEAGHEEEGEGAQRSEEREHAEDHAELAPTTGRRDARQRRELRRHARGSLRREARGRRRGRPGERGLVDQRRGARLIGGGVGEGVADGQVEAPARRLRERSPHHGDAVADHVLVEGRRRTRLLLVELAEHRAGERVDTGHHARRVGVGVRRVARRGLLLGKRGDLWPGAIRIRRVLVGLRRRTRGGHGRVEGVAVVHTGRVVVVVRPGSDRASPFDLMIESLTKREGIADGGRRADGVVIEVRGHPEPGDERARRVRVPQRVAEVDAGGLRGKVRHGGLRRRERHALGRLGRKRGVGQP